MAKFKVVATDTHRFPVGIEAEILAREDAEVIRASLKTEDDLIADCRDADAVLTANGKFSRRVIAELPRLRAICRYGIGVDTVDVAAATDDGVIVANVPDFCIDEVSDTAMTMILALARRLVRTDGLIKRGIYDREGTRPIHKLRGSVLGLVGFGNIGRAVCRKAEPFGFRVLTYDPYVKAAAVGDYPATLVDRDRVLRDSDFVSIHTPLTAETRHLIGEAELRRMKPSAYLVNTSRGRVVDGKALYRALKEGWIAGAGLDVLEEEPPRPDEPLLTLDNVILTPHYAGYSEEAFQELRVKVAENAAAVLRGEFPKYVFNPEVRSKARILFMH